MQMHMHGLTKSGSENDADGGYRSNVAEVRAECIGQRHSVVAKRREGGKSHRRSDREHRIASENEVRLVAAMVRSQTNQLKRRRWMKRMRSIGCARPDVGWARLNPNPSQPNHVSIPLHVFT